MSILGSIFGKIFKRDRDDDRSGKTATQGDKPLGQTPGKSVPVTDPLGETDVEAIVEKHAQSKGEPLNWKSSIVDLMKALDLDSSLQNRKALADELGYTGDKSDTAAMNIWLHKQVMRKIRENGGKVPADIAD